jgi:hypothetical protein
MAKPWERFQGTKKPWEQFQSDARSAQPAPLAPPPEAGRLPGLGAPDPEPAPAAPEAPRRSSAILPGDGRAIADAARPETRGERQYRELTNPPRPVPVEPQAPEERRPGVGSSTRRDSLQASRDRAAEADAGRIPQPMSDLGKRVWEMVVEGAASNLEGGVSREGNPAPSFPEFRSGAEDRLAQRRDQFSFATRLLMSGTGPDGNPLTDAERADLQSAQAWAREEIARIETEVGALTPNPPATWADSRSFEAGNDLRAWGEKLVGAPDPQFDDRFASSLASGAGSMAYFIGVGILTGGVGTAYSGATMNQSQVYRDALAFGADEDTARQAARWGAVIGSSEVIPIMRALEPLERYAPGIKNRVAAAIIKKIGGNATEEAIQEGTSQVLNNLVAKGYYDPERGITEGVAESALIGAILGGGVGAIGAARPGGLTEDAAPGADPDPQRLNSPRLTESDRASPIPNDVIDDGKATIEAVLNGAPLPPVATPAQPAPPVGTDQVAQPPAPVPPSAPEAPAGLGAPAAPDAPPVAPAASVEGRRLGEPMPVIDGDEVVPGQYVAQDLDTGEFVDVSDQVQQSQQPPTPQPDGKTQPEETDAAPAPPPAAPRPVPDAGDQTPVGLGPVDRPQAGADAAASSVEVPAAAEPRRVPDQAQAPARPAQSRPVRQPPDRAAFPDTAEGNARFAEADARWAYGSLTRPVITTLRDNGIRIDPNGKAAIDLEAMGVTPRTAPGLFKRGGLKDLDNIVASEFEALREIVKTDDGTGYFDLEDLKSAISEEVSKSPRLPDAVRQAVNLREEADRRRSVRGLVDQWSDENEISALTEAEKEDMVEILLAEPDYEIEDAAERVFIRSERDSEADVRASDQGRAGGRQAVEDEIPFGEVEPRGPEGSRPAPDTGRADQPGQGEAQSERTDAGEQLLTPGVAPITEADRQQAEVTRRSDAPMRGRNEGPASGRDDLFGNPEDRRDLFDAPQAETETARQVDDLGNPVPNVSTRQVGTTPQEARDQARARREAQSGPKASPAARRALDTLSKEERARLDDINKRLADKLRNQTNSGLDPELVSLAVESATLYVKAGVRRFREYITALADATGLPIQTLGRYARIAYNDVRDEMEANGEAVADMDDSRAVIQELARLNREERDNAPGTGGDLEQDRGDAGPQDGLGAADVPAAAGRDVEGAGPGGGADRQGGGRRRTGGGGVSAGDAAGLGSGRDRGTGADRRAEPGASADQDRAGSRDRRQQRLPDDEGTAADTARAASDAPGQGDRARQQAEADRLTVKPGDEANVRATLPLLLPEQQDDVLKVERRFAKPDGFGMLLTNSTGTGKTYSAGGVIKRFAQQGKTNVLILAPSQGILDAWVGMGKDLGLDITKLADTGTAGDGIVATTYANAAANDALAKREWDLIVPDEAHNLSSNQAGEQTGALKALRAVSNHPDGRYTKAKMLLADEWAKAEAMPPGKPQDAVKQALWTKTRDLADSLKARGRSRVLFLSATPFAYDKNTDYAEGYLFQYGEDGVTDSGSRQSGRNLFMVQNFGYRIRYHKLTQPEAAVDRGVFEREFHERLKREGSLSGRSLSVEADYDRRFSAVDSTIGNDIDRALEYLRNKQSEKGAGEGWRQVNKLVTRHFGYLERMQLLEAIKAEKAIPDIRKHLDMGRKVVVFHDFNVGGGRSPFSLPIGDGELGYGEFTTFLAENPYVTKLDFSGLAAPKEQIKAAFGTRAREYNGTVPNRERAAAKEAFNRDGSGVDVLIVQSAAGEAGISLHDTSGKHQRALINLGMPTRPVTTLQQEGRIRRVGSVSDAIFRYYTIGTTWEREAFARKIAEKSGTVENLALGNEARAIRESFIEAYTEADRHPPGMEGEGKGGKDRDRSVALTSPYEQAKTHYFARQKNTRNRQSRQGIDFYATPEPLGFKMVGWAGAREYEKVLEPSAGDGAIARYFPENTDRTIIEPSADLASQAQLRTAGARSVTGTFEGYHINNKHDVIVMNPPFGNGGKTAYEHVAKAMKHLRPGGRIVALVPRGPAADKNMAKLLDPEMVKVDEWHLTASVELPPVAFEKAGTSVRTYVMVLDRTMEPVDAPTRRINMTGAESIAEFFERLEGIDVPARPAALVEPGAIAEMSNAADEAALTIQIPEVAAAADGFDTFDFAHSQTGERKYGANAKERVTREQYDAMKEVARQHGGYWSRYQNAAQGAKRGFLFPSADDRDAFVDAMTRPTAVKEQRRLTMQDDDNATEGVFYSPLLRAVQGAKQTKAPAGDWKAILSKMPGVKQVEIEWIGVYDWLDSQEGAQVPRAALEQFIRDGQIDLVEEVLGDRMSYLSDAFDSAREDEMFEGWTDAEIEEQILADAEAEGSYEPPRFEEYTERGGENYREVLIRVPNLHETGKNLPDPTYDRAAQERDRKRMEEIYAENGVSTSDMQAVLRLNRENDELRQINDRLVQRDMNDRGKSPFVQSAHFVQENIVVHARLKDRSGPNGERILFVEEIQSDLASKWRENTESPEVTARRRELEAEASTLQRENERTLARVQRRAERTGKWDADWSIVAAAQAIEEAIGIVRGDESPRRASDPIRRSGIVNEMTGPEWADLREEVQAQFDRDKELRDARLALGTERSMDPSTPDTPFKEEHTYALMVKRLLRMAAEQGYDRLAWTPGYMQAERWNNAAQSVVEEVEWYSPDQVALAQYRYVDLTMSDGGRTISTSVTPQGVIEGAAGNDMLEGKALSALIGPSLARQIMSEPSGSITGQKITFPDSGYAIAYDQQIKRSVDRIAKGTGARVEQARDMPDFSRTVDEDMLAPVVANLTPEQALQVAVDGVEESAQTVSLWKAKIAKDGPRALLSIRPRRLAERLERMGIAIPGNPVWSITITPELREKALAPQPILQKPAFGAQNATIMDEATVRELLPGFRERLERVGLGRVRLGIDLTGQRQGAMLVNRMGAIDILIGASLNPKATLYHEVIHALRVGNLFSDAEWSRLSKRAEETWIAKHQIEERYPDLTREEQIEEAIAEEFGVWAAGRDDNPGGIRLTFDKIKRFLKAIAEALTSRGFFTADDVFGKVLSGEVGRRHAGNTGSRRRMFPIGLEGMPDEAVAAQRDQTLDSPQSPQFKRWFGDSKVVGSDGAPLVVYHGTNADFEAFDPKKVGSTFNDDKKGFFFTNSTGEDMASGYATMEGARDGGNIIAAYVALQNPYTTRDYLFGIGYSDAELDAMTPVEMSREALDGRGVVGWWDYMKRSLMPDIERGGFDGVLLEDFDMNVRGEPEKLVVAFRPEQVKSIFNQGTFNPDTAIMREQRPARAVRRLSAAGRQKVAQSTNTSHIPDRRVFDELARRNVSVLDRIGGARGAIMDRIDRTRIVLQDRMLPLLRAEEGITATTGDKIDRADSAYFAEERYSGRVGARLDAIDEQFTKPIIGLIADASNSKAGAITLTDKDGRTRTGADAAGIWLAARHAKERNARIAAINPNMPDGGAGMTNAEADAILSEAASSPHADRLRKIGVLTDRLGRQMIDLREQAGLLTGDEADTWRRMYQHYVPLRGFSETEMYDLVVNEYSGIGRRYTVRGPETQRALGRTSEAFNPLATILTMAQEVSIRAEKNLVGQAVVRLAQRYPNPAMWEVSKPETQRFYNRKSGYVESRVVGPTARPMGPNEMAVKIDGVEHRLTLKDPRLASALGQLGSEQMGVFMRVMSGFSRYFSAINTMLSPPFIIVNAFRDMVTAQVNMGEQVPKGMQARVRKAALGNWGRAFLGAYKGMGGKANTQWAQHFKEFEASGAKVSFWKIETPELMGADLERRIGLASGTKLGSKLRRLVRPSTRDNPALAWIERVNLSVDNAVRLASFVEARAAGMSIEDAASLSKNLTVNFNRRGEIGAQMNALFPFANAAIQGSQVLIKAMGSRQVKATVVGMVLFGIANDLLNAMLSARDDDDELEYDQIPNYILARNLVLATPWDETFATVPLPYGYNAFFYLGNRIGKVMRGVVPADRAVGQVLSTFVGAFSPLSGETAQQFFMPTALDHVNELAQNRDWLGRPIRPENPYGDFGPQAYKEYSATGPSRALARTLNWATGGSELESGVIDISPEYFDHTAKFLTGGAGRFAMQTYGLAEMAAEGRLQDVEAYQIPLVRVMRTESADFLDTNRYFRFRSVVEESRAMVRRAEERGIPPLESHVRAAGLYSALRAAERERRGLSDKIDNVYADDSLSGRERADQLRPLTEERGTVYKRFNRAFIEAMGPQAE